MLYTSIWGIYNSIKLLTALSITASKTAGAALTSLSLTMLQRLNYEFPWSQQVRHRCPHWEGTPTQLVPLSAAFHPVLSLTGFTCLLAQELFKQANHVLPQEPEVTSPSCYYTVCVEHVHITAPPGLLCSWVQPPSSSARHVESSSLDLEWNCIILKS